MHCRAQVSTQPDDCNGGNSNVSASVHMTCAPHQSPAPIITRSPNDKLTQTWQVHSPIFQFRIGFPRRSRCPHMSNRLKDENRAKTLIRQFQAIELRSRTPLIGCVPLNNLQPSHQANRDLRFIEISCADCVTQRLPISNIGHACPCNAKYSDYPASQTMTSPNKSTAQLNGMGTHEFQV